MNNDELRQHIDGRFDLLDGRLNNIDDRITTNAKERLEEVVDLRADLDEHKDRNHGSGRIATGGLAGAIAAIIVAVFETLKRLG